MDFPLSSRSFSTLSVETLYKPLGVGRFRRNSRVFLNFETRRCRFSAHRCRRIPAGFLPLRSVPPSGVVGKPGTGGTGIVRQPGVGVLSSRLPIRFCCGPQHLVSPSPRMNSERLVRNMLFSFHLPVGWAAVRNPCFLRHLELDSISLCFLDLLPLTFWVSCGPRPLEPPSNNGHDTQNIWF